MIEFSQDTRYDRAFKAAHDARGEMVAGFWRSLFPRRR